MAKHADASPFARRMMERPLSPSLDVGPDDRHFYDPPELIQKAFGGRPWFFEQCCRAVHRVGLYRGLGWELDPADQLSNKLGATGVRITLGREERCTMSFVKREILRDEGGFIVDQTTAIVASQTGLLLSELKPTYERMLYDHD
jgi:hypothetical protein